MGDTGEDSAAESAVKSKANVLRPAAVRSGAVEGSPGQSGAVRPPAVVGSVRPPGGRFGVGGLVGGSKTTGRSPLGTGRKRANEAAKPT